MHGAYNPLALWVNQTRKKNTHMKWRVKLRILIEVLIFTLFRTVLHNARNVLWGSWGWRYPSAVQPARVNIILFSIHCTQFVCDVFVLFHRFGGKQRRHYLYVFLSISLGLGDFPLYECKHIVCRCISLQFLGLFESLYLWCCLKLCRLLACCHRRYHRFAAFFMRLWILHNKYSSTQNKTIGTKHTIADGTSEYIELPYFQHADTRTVNIQFVVCFESFTRSMLMTTRWRDWLLLMPPPTVQCHWLCSVYFFCFYVLSLSLSPSLSSICNISQFYTLLVAFYGLMV